jgi:nucleotide-binding universal stress UspA family protein
MHNFRKILVPFDFSDSARQALRTALHLAGRFESELTILNVIDRDPDVEASKLMFLPEDLESRLEEKIQAEVDALIPLAEPSHIRLQPVVRKGKAPLEILLEAEQQKPDLIVMGSKGKTGLQHLLLGSVAERVLRRATVPVWVCRGQSNRLPEKILVPVDFSAYSREALEEGVRWAKDLNAELYILHVIDLRDLYTHVPIGPTLENDLKREAEMRLKDWMQFISFPARTEVRVGDPVYEIQNSIRENSIDLVLLSTHGRTGLKHMLMGSIAEQTVRYSPCPVMTICPPALASSAMRLFDGEKEFEDYIRSFRG